MSAGFQVVIKMMKEFFKKNTVKDWINIASIAIIIACLSMNDFEGWNGIEDILRFLLRLTLIIVVCTFLKETDCTKRDIVISGLCGMVFAVFMSCGISAEKDMGWTSQDRINIFKPVIYLIVYSVMYGMLVLGLFKAIALIKTRGGRARVQFGLFGL